MHAVSDARPSRSQAWWQAVRPKTLGLALAPVVVGSAWAFAMAGMFRLEVALLAALAAVAIQVGTNLWNDALDAELGVDGDVRLGPRRATAAGWLAAASVRAASLAAFALAGACGAVLIAIGGWPILFIGVVAIALGLLYSAGPRPISATPLGEVVVLATFGVAGVAGTVLLHGAAVTPAVALLGACSGLPAAAVLLVNNHRDRGSDRIAGRRTLAILLGPEATRRLYAGLVLASALGPVVVAAGCAVAWLAAALLLVPAFGLARGFAVAPVDAGLNRYLVRTARFQLLQVLALAAALLACGPAASVVP